MELININYKKLSEAEGFTFSVKGDRRILYELMIAVIGFIGLTLTTFLN